MTTKSTAPKADETEQAKKTVIDYTLDDGTVVRVDPSKVSAVVMLERELGQPFDANSTEHQMKMAHMASGHLGGTNDIAFLEFCDRIDNVEPVEVPKKA